MFTVIKSLGRSLISKTILAVGVTLLISISTWAYFIINYQKKTVMENIVAASDKLSTTIKLGTHYAMTLNSRDEIRQIINNIAKQRDIEHIRIYNKQGQIKFSNRPDEIDKTTNIRAEACYVCHRSEPPLAELDLPERIRIYPTDRGQRRLGILSPIFNEPTCSTESCHVHPQGKKILGALDLVVSLEETDAEIAVYTTRAFTGTILVILFTSTTILVTILLFVRQPMTQLIAGTKVVAAGGQFDGVDIHQEDEVGQLAAAFNKMAKEVSKKQTELNRQRDEYQHLFEQVPCIITVQDRSYRLLKYNREFARKFNPSPGDFCYKAYKKRDEKCPICPVEKTFESGWSHSSEESGLNVDGTINHWVVQTSPIINEHGEIVAAMEMCLDITQRKQLEDKLEKSEKKYYAIFNNIPNPVFVLDIDSLVILDCNESVKHVYDYEKEDIIHEPFLNFFRDAEREQYTSQLKSQAFINQARQTGKDGRTIYVNIRISPSEYPGQKVLLVTTSDITARLEAEQQFMQAGKMATLGEMATGVAHELNQPLSVIKTASSFFMKKVKKKEPISESILFTLAAEIDSHVDRASRIINHMREFGRKSEMKLDKLQINEIMKRAYDLFAQQLKIRSIEVVWNLDESLPMIMGDAGRLEQVFINLLINARDSIETKWQNQPHTIAGKKIVFLTYISNNKVIVEVKDNGTGIPKAIQNKIFEPFFTTKELSHGTGLGLSISYGVIQDCHGQIRVESREGEGANFIIEFPIPDDGDVRTAINRC